MLTGAFTSTTFYDKDAYIWNESDNTLTSNTDYDGVNALFTLPLDKEKAEPKKAANYLNTILDQFSEAKSSDFTEDATTQEEIEDMEPYNISPLDPNFDKYYTLIENSVTQTRPGEDNMIHYEYASTDGHSICADTLFSELFPNNTPGISKTYSMNSSDSEWWIISYELMEDGSVTVRTYQSQQ